jgi:hypothetical protein
MDLKLKVGEKHLLHWRDLFEASHLEEIGDVGAAQPEWQTGTDPHVVALNWGVAGEGGTVEPRTDGKCLVIADNVGTTQVQAKITNAAGQIHASSADVEVTE